MALHSRRNINCLGSEALHDLREALARMQALPAADEHSFAALAGLHGNPGNFCRHGAPGFLTWHRAYMYYFERALRCIDSDVTLPFWDWSSGPTTGVPAACADPTYVNRQGQVVPNPLYAGPLPGGGSTARRADIATTTFGDIATAAQSALTGSADFASFQSALNGPHGSVHVRTGGHMGSVPLAAYDPIFYLHHCNVDRLWARWQQSHPGPLPATEAADLLDPFRLPYSNTLRPGADFADIAALGYRYLNFCFILPPIRVWEVIRIDRIDPWWLDQGRSARLAVRSRKLPRLSAELRVFVDAADATAETATAHNPNLAGTIGLFGAAAHSHAKPAGDAKKAAPNGTADAGHAHGGPAANDRAERFDIELELGPALSKRLAQEKGATLKIVPVDSDGKGMGADHFEIDEIELLFD